MSENADEYDKSDPQHYNNYKLMYDIIETSDKKKTSVKKINVKKTNVIVVNGYTELSDIEAELNALMN